ncbi:MAG: energy transducer TonB, partial [Bacteroidia bacterium]|nr:energy transducer TonB [Bacteroidia bacterium]
KVTKESVLKGVDPALDEEALRVVRTLPGFKPGRQGGKAVPVWYMVPINFTLK